MAISEADRQSIKALADLLDENGLCEIEYEHKGLRVRVARSVRPPDAALVTGSPRSSEVKTADADPPCADEDERDAAASIVSPMVGTFYAAPSPESSAFVRVGDRVRKGQVVCIIEAMKLMNEIESDYDGVVAEQLVEDAHGVEFGQALFHIKVD